MAEKERLWTAAEVIRRTGRNPEMGELFWFPYDEYDRIIEKQMNGAFSREAMLFAAQGIGLRDERDRLVRSKVKPRQTFDLVREAKQDHVEVRSRIRYLLEMTASGHA